MKKLVDYFIKGLLVFVPMALTVFLLIWAFTSLDAAFSCFVQNQVPRSGTAADPWAFRLRRCVRASIVQLCRQCLLFPKDAVKSLSIESSQAMAFIVSGGVSKGSS